MPAVVAPRHPYLDGPFPRAFAHRGWHLDELTGMENSLAAFRRAVAEGYRYLETDVRATQDGVVVILHDATLDRTTDGSGEVEQLGWAAVRTARVGSRNYRCANTGSPWWTARWCATPIVVAWRCTCGRWTAPPRWKLCSISALTVWSPTGQTCSVRCCAPGGPGPVRRRRASNVGEPTVPLDETERRRDQRAWCWYDWANSVFPTSIVTVFVSLYLTTVAVNDARASGQICPSGNALAGCDISLFGLEFPAGSLFGYLLAASTALQVLVLPLTGAIADRTQHKRWMLGLFTFIGAGATALLALVTGTNWRLGVVLFIVATTGYHASVVIYYSVLPEIATADERDMLSSRGWAFGFLRGGIALALNLATYLGRDALGLSESAAVRVCFLTAGLWWAAFTLIPLSRMRRYRPPQGNERGMAVLTAGVRQLWGTLRSARR